MREGPQLSMEQREILVAPICEQEILIALNGICDLKSPGIYGFSARFFKASWEVVKEDVIDAIMEFFENERFI